MRWNEDFGTNGAWDPTGCTLIKTDALETKCECMHFGAQVNKCPCLVLYRVFHHLADLGLVDLDFGYSTVCPILFGQMGVYSNGLTQSFSFNR